jgi:hypothetical protein
VDRAFSVLALVLVGVIAISVLVPIEITVAQTSRLLALRSS